MNTSSGVRHRPASRAPVVVIQPRFVAQAIGWVVLGLTALLVVERSQHVLELVLLAVVIAVVLRAPIEALSRNLPRWAAVLVVVLASLASVAGLLALGTVQLRQEIDVVGNEVNQRIEEVDPDSSLGQFLADANVAERIDDHLDRLPSQILIGSPDPADGARLGLEALLVIVLVLYALINGPGLARALLGGSSPRWWAGYAGRESQREPPRCGGCWRWRPSVVWSDWQRPTPSGSPVRACWRSGSGCGRSFRSSDR